MAAKSIKANIPIIIQYLNTINKRTTVHFSVSLGLRAIDSWQAEGCGDRNILFDAEIKLAEDLHCDVIKCIAYLVRRIVVILLEEHIAVLRLEDRRTTTLQLSIGQEISPSRTGLSRARGAERCRTRTARAAARRTSGVEVHRLAHQFHSIRRIERGRDLLSPRYEKTTKNDIEIAYIAGFWFVDVRLTA